MKSLCAKERTIRPRTVGWLSLVLVLGIFLPVLLTTYGIYDAVRMALDYGWLGESRLTGVILGGGRFIYAGLAQIGFSRTPFLEDLWMLRALGVGGLLLSSWAIASFACRSGWGVASALCLSLVAVVNPGSAAYGFWSACFPYGYALFLAFASGLLWEREAWRWRLGSVLMLQVSMAVYQPAALYFMVGPFIAWFGREQEQVRPWRAIWCFLGLSLGMVLHLLLFRLSVQVIPGVADQGSRLAGSGIGEALGHILSRNLPQLLSSWGGFLPGYVAAVYMGICLGGILLYGLSSRGASDRFLRVWALLPVCLTFVPALISADHYTPYRLLAPAYCALWLVALTGLRDGLARSPLLKKVFPAALAVLLVVSSAYVIRYGIVKPRDREHQVVAAALAAFGTPPPGVSVIRPRGLYPIDQHIRPSSEYGAFELSYPGFSEAFLSLIAARTYGWKPDGETFPLNRIHWVFYAPDTDRIPVFYPVLDLRQSLQALDVQRPPVDQGTAVEHPFVGNCLFFGPSLYLSPEFGLFQQEADNWFFKPGLGWMQWEGQPGETPLRARDVKGAVLVLTPSAE